MRDLNLPRLSVGDTLQLAAALICTVGGLLGVALILGGVILP